MTPSSQQLPLTRQQFNNEHLVHQYFRSRYTTDGKKMVWACKHPLCEHTLFVPKNDRSVLIGRMTICPQCQTTKFLLTQEDVKRKIPLCVNCKKGGEARQETVERVKNIFDKIFEGGAK